jgi:hypothetical protein
VNGAFLVEDRFGNAESAYDFSTPNDHIIVQTINQTSFEGDFTLSVWVNFRNFYNDYPHIVSGMNNYFAFHGQGPVYYPDNEKVGFYTTSINSTHQGLMVSQDPLSINTWHHIIINKHDTVVSLYVDNLISASNTHDNLPLTSGEGLYFGNFYFLNNNIDGMIDEIGIWKRSLSPEEMTDLHFMPNTGLRNISFSEAFRITPNPAHDYFTINDLSEISGSNLLASIYTISGQLVLSQELDKCNSVINLTNIYSQGLYTVKISNKEGRSWFHKLLIQ